MEFFNINIATVILRFYLMMAVIIAGVFTGQWWLIVLGLPVFLSIMLGLTIKKRNNAVEAGMSHKSKRASNAA